MLSLMMDCVVSTDVKYYVNDEKGVQVAHFNVAYNQGKDKDAMFFNTTVFGRNAYNAYKYVKKGMPLLVRAGQLKPVTYSKKDSDTEVQTFELIIHEFKMLPSAKDKELEKMSESNTGMEISDDDKGDIIE